MKLQPRMSPAWLVTTACVAIAFVASVATVAFACSTPVFRYALERWAADPYDVAIVSRGPLSAADRALVDRLNAAAAASPAPLNIAVRTVDLDATPDEALAAASKSGDPKRPTIVLYYPTHKDEKRLAYAAPLDAAAVDALLDSPVRREVGKRLMNNHSVVWVFVDSSDAAANEVAIAQLNKTLGQLEKEISAAAPSSAEGAAVAPDVVADLSKVKIKFSLLRIKADDAGERVFKKILLNSEDELDASKPMVFPIFGRGRALYAIAGRGINESNIAAAVSFLTGACSCEVKAQNPGTDVPLATDWTLSEEQRVVPGGGDPELTSIAAVSEQAKPTPAATPVTPAARTAIAATPAAGGTMWSRVLLIVVIGAVIALVVSALLTRGSKGRGESS